MLKMERLFVEPLSMMLVLNSTHYVTFLYDIVFTEGGIKVGSWATEAMIVIVLCV